MNKIDKYFLLSGSIMTILFFVIVNLLTGADYPWSIYPLFAILIGATSVIFGVAERYKQQAIYISGLLIVFLLLINVMHSPSFPWFLFAVYPILWWPILVSLGKRAQSIRIAIIGSMCTIIYYFILNMFFAPNYLWFIYPTFMILWWPLSIFHTKRKTFYRYSIHGSILISLFFIIVNLISSPDTVWAIYPIFAVLWWPLSMYYYFKKENRS
ncbi:hypothetical protein [Niallia sp.]|uniref:hypothetical protein n=1 Tax=Niallia sp. TaxID=2837523 RepID=UPI00289F818F|nr:hypothetical protein [Niallia sp.]